MAEKLIKVAQRNAAHYGCHVQGAGGSVYLMHANTGELHLVTGGVASPEAGCLPDCAKMLLTGSSKEFRRVDTPEPPKKSAPEKADVLNPNSPVLDQLDQSVKDLTLALESGKHDKHLKNLLKAEKAGKTRRSAVEAIKDRLSQIGN